MRLERDLITRFGSKPMLNNVMERLNDHGVDIWYGSEITNIFDKNTKVVHWKLWVRKLLQNVSFLGTALDYLCTKHLEL